MQYRLLFETAITHALGTAIIQNRDVKQSGTHSIRCTTTSCASVAHDCNQRQVADKVQSGHANTA